MGCSRLYAAVCLLSAGLPLAAADWPQIQLVRQFSGVDLPTHVTSAGDGSGRLFVVEQRGRIRVVRNGALLPAPLLDITGRVGCCGERGLLSVAFPPNFAGKRYFYVNYTNRDGNTVISRFPLASDDTAVAGGETILLTINQPFSNHNGGGMVFGRDGYLYIGMGDGGGGGDTLGNAQRHSELLGKMLRIDVESGASPYAVPPSNPFVGNSDYRPEIWAVGMRNPWRFSFDRQTADLYIGDVGQDTYEEVDFQPASSAGGENYGWNLMEGNHCYTPGCSPAGLVAPVAEYDHGQGCSVTGGFVYRGARSPQWSGIYFYADYCNGRIWGLQRTAAGWENKLLLESGNLISSFGEDEAGELYVTDQQGGAVYQMTLVGGTAPPPATVVNAASFDDGITPGSIATVTGTGLSRVTGVVSANTYPLPTVLQGTSVTVNGTAAPLFAVINQNGSEQINFQVPYAVAGSATATVVVNNNGATAATVRANVLAAAPGLFSQDGVHAASLHPDYRLIGTSSPAEKGEVVLLYGTGFGAVDNPPEAGKAATVSPLSRTAAVPAVSIGGRDSEVLFSGLAPGLAGVYQINVRVPADAPSGEPDVVVTMGRPSRSVRLPVR